CYRAGGSPPMGGANWSYKADGEIMAAVFGRRNLAPSVVVCVVYRDKGAYYATVLDGRSGTATSARWPQPLLGVQRTPSIRFDGGDFLVMETGLISIRFHTMSAERMKRPESWGR